VQRTTRKIFFFLLLTAIAGQVDAQVLRRPERASRPPARTIQELTLTLNSLGGYDDNPVIEGTAGNGLDILTQREPGYTGFADAALRFFRERLGHSFETSGRAYVNSFHNIDLRPSYGGDVQARLTTPLGRRNQLQLAAGGRSDSFYSLGSFSSLRADVGQSALPDANPSNGSYERRSLAGDATISFLGRWSARSAFNAAYRYNFREFRDHIGDTRSHTGLLDYAHNLRRRSTIRISYRRSNSEYGDRRIDAELKQVDILRPVTENSGELGYQHERAVSRTRSLVFAVGGGASYVRTVTLTNEPLEFQLPSGYASTRLDIARTWSVQADYRRGLSLLEGVTIEQFVTNTGMIRLGGLLGSHSELVFAAGYSTGSAAPGSSGSIESYNATSQFRYKLTESLSMLFGHTYYSYHLLGVQDLPSGFANRLDRNAIRVGMTLELPLYSGSPRQGSARGQRN
jgi:hypothetical protein